MLKLGEIVTKSTIKTNDKITLAGKEYPLFKVDISSGSHPFSIAAIYLSRLLVAVCLLEILLQDPKGRQLSLR